MLRYPLVRARSAILPAGSALALALGGCADGGASYPSLASRPAEQLTEPTRPAAADSVRAPDVLSADLATRLEELVAQARRARRDFDDQRVGAERLVSAARGAPAGSEGWAQATQAVSGIQSARSQTAQPLADLDRLEIDDRLAHPAPASDTATPPRADAAAIAQARDSVAAMVAAEDEILAKLDGRLES